jgi:hypothetical protein
VVYVEPTLSAKAEGVARQLDAMIPAAVRVDQPARDPGEIP